MKRLIINIIALMTIGQLSAQTMITGSEWDNPLVTSVNRETAHMLANHLGISHWMVCGGSSG